MLLFTYPHNATQKNMGFRFRKRGYRKIFGHRSPYRRMYGARGFGRAVGVTARQIGKATHITAGIVKDISDIKSRLNVEKKHIEKLLTGSSGDEGFEVAQINHNSDGIIDIDVTPAISQGIQHDQRVGNSLKMTGMAFKYQLQGQVNNHTRQKVKFTLAKVSSPDIASVSATEVAAMIWDVNPLTDVRDTNAPLNYSTLKQNGIKIIRTHTCYLPGQSRGASSADGSNDGVMSGVQHKTGKFAVSMQDLIRFSSASATAPEGHKYLLFIQADVGNRDGSGVSGKTDVPIRQNQTGSLLRMHSKYWWVDN